MKPRARRVTIGAALVGAGVVGVLIVLQFRLHLEAWRFQRTRRTAKIEPDHGLRESLAGAAGAMEVDVKSCLRVLSTYSGFCVIAEQERIAHARVMRSKNVEDRDPLILSALTADAARYALEARGWRVIKQHIPRRAYVVFRDEPIRVEESPPTFPTPGTIPPLLLEEELELDPPSPGILLPPLLLDDKPVKSDPALKPLREEQ